MILKIIIYYLILHLKQKYNYTLTLINFIIKSMISFHFKYNHLIIINLINNNILMLKSII